MNFSDNFLEEENGSFDLNKELKYYLFFWPWFLVSIIIFSFASFIYVRYENTIFQTSATIQVKDGTSDPSSFLTESTTMFNIGRIKIDNYIAQILSNPNLSEVTNILDLETKIFAVGRVKDKLIFGDEVPFQINFKHYNKIREIRLVLNGDKGILKIGLDEVTFDLSIPYENDDFIINFNPSLLNEIYKLDKVKKHEFLIKRLPKEKVISDLSRKIKVSSSSKTGDNIDLIVRGSNINYNEAVINSLIKVSEKQQISDKQKIYNLSNDFINKRLVVIKKEIDSLSLITTGFKSDNLIFSPEVQTVLALNNMSALDKERFDLNTQKDLAISLKNNLGSQESFSLLPSNIGLSNNNVNELVVSYNQLVLKRKNLLAGATIKNPLVVKISDDLIDLRKNILKSIDNYISNIETSLSKFKDFRNKTNIEISKIPNLEARLLGLQRKFQIAEKLYLFLLERREEVSISLESTLPNTRVINYATTDYNPVSPKKELIYVGSVLFGFILPFGILYLLKILDTKIHTREELEKLMPNVPIVGEVPFVEDIRSVQDPRGIFAESSRVIRSNISYQLEKNKNCHVILSTSSIKGEGKTMTAFNISSSFAATGKKVLLIGADLRNPQVHSMIDLDRKRTQFGLSTLIRNKETQLSREHLESIDIFGNKLDVLLSGPIPPNPSELLGSEQFILLLENIKLIYDYIIIDSAPLLLVSDSIPLLKLVDLVIYTTRAHYTDKKLIPFIKKIIEEKEIKNLSVVLNGIRVGAKSYYKYGYAYRYSYKYKYNYGYGYGYGEDGS